MQMDMSMVQTSTQYTVHREQRMATNWPHGLRNPSQDTLGLMKTVEGVYMKSMSHEDELKRREHDVDRLRQDLQRALQENEKLRAKTLEEERSRISDSTLKEELLNNRVIMDGIVSTQTELKAHMKQYGSMAHEIRDINALRMKRLDECSRFIEDLKDKQRERKELKKKIMTLQRSNHVLQEKLSEVDRALAERSRAVEMNTQALLQAEEEKAAIQQEKTELNRQLEAKITYATLLGHQELALVHMFATDLKVAEAGLASSADALLESQEQCKGLTKRLAVAQEDSRTLSIGLEMQREASAAAAKDFEAKIDDLTSDIKASKDEVLELQERVHSLIRDKKAEDDSHSSMVMKLNEDHASAMDAAMRDFDHAKQEVQDLRNQKNEAEERCARAQADLVERLAQANQARQSHQEALNALQKEFDATAESLNIARAEALKERTEAEDKLEKLKNELKEARVACEAEHVAARSHNQQQLLNLRGQLDALQLQKVQAEGLAQEHRQATALKVAELERKNAQLEEFEAQLKDLTEKLVRAESALSETQQRAASSEKRLSELDAVRCSLLAEICELKSRTEALVKRKCELEEKLAVVESSHHPPSKCANLSDERKESRQPMQGCPGSELEASRAQCLDLPPPSPSEARTGNQEAFTSHVLTDVVSSVHIPVSTSLDGPRGRRRSSSSASKRSVSQSMPASKSVSAQREAARAHGMNGNLESMGADYAKDEAPSMPRAPQGAQRMKNAIAVAPSPPVHSQAGPLPSGRRTGAVPKRKAQRVSMAARPSDIFDFD